MSRERVYQLLREQAVSCAQAADERNAPLLALFGQVQLSRYGINGIENDVRLERIKEFGILRQIESLAEGERKGRGDAV